MIVDLDRAQRANALRVRTFQPVSVADILHYTFEATHLCVSLTTMA